MGESKGDKMASARRGGFIRGLGGMFSFIDVLNRRLLASSPAEADAEALREDWERVGNYLYDAMGAYSTVYTISPDDMNENICRKTTANKKSSR